MEVFEYDENGSFAEHLKCLEDDALLDFWEESQALASSMPFLQRPAMTELRKSEMPPSEAFVEFMELALRTDGNDLRGFAIPLAAQAKPETGAFWNSGGGRDGIVLQELQLRGARRCLAGYSGS